jgi:hypothetical protein
MNIFLALSPAVESDELKSRRKFYDGEKAFHLRSKLLEHKLFVCFVRIWSTLPISCEILSAYDATDGSLTIL